METACFKTQSQSKPQTRIPPKRGRVKLLIFRSFRNDDRVVRPRSRGIYRGCPKRGRIKLMILRSILGLSVVYNGYGGPPSPYNSDRHSDS